MTQIESKNKSLLSIGELAAQVAHDIRSPVAALMAMSETLEGFDPKKKQLIEKAATRINNIADYLVSEYRTNLTSDLMAKSTSRAVYLNEVIQEIVDEKKLMTKNSYQIHVSAPEMINVPDQLNLIEFKRILSNLLNNSIEAFDKPINKIIVSLTRNNNLMKIKIEDNGKGMPQDILNKLFEKGVSYNKKSGTGLGLAHAKSYLESVHGKITLSSELGQGTVVEIQIAT